MYKIKMFQALIIYLVLFCHCSGDRGNSNQQITRKRKSSARESCNMPSESQTGLSSSDLSPSTSKDPKLMMSEHSHKTTVSSTSNFSRRSEVANTPRNDDVISENPPLFSSSYDENRIPPPTQSTEWIYELMDDRSIWINKEKTMLFHTRRPRYIMPLKHSDTEARYKKLRLRLSDEE